MLLGHGMVDGDEMLILHAFHRDAMLLILIFRFQRRQGDAAAADHRRTHAMNRIAANGTDIEFPPQHIGRDILIGDLLPVHQLDDGNAQRLRQRLQKRNIRQTLGRFPFGHGLAADADAIGQLRLGEFAVFPQLLDGVSGDISIHVHPRLSPKAYHELGRMATYGA